MRRPVIDLITFDADQTLTDFRAVLAVALTETAAFLNHHLTVAVEPGALQALREEMIRRPGNDRLGMLDLRRLSFLELLGDHPKAPEIADAAVKLFTDIRFNRIPLMPGALGMLNALQGKVQIGWVTNGNSKPHHIGLERFFDLVVVAEEIGHSKPAPEIFHHTLDLAGVCAEHWIHVGDHPEMDIHGAQAAGGRAVYLDNPDHPLGQIAPNHHIASLAELPAILTDYTLRRTRQ